MTRAPSLAITILVLLGAMAVWNPTAAAETTLYTVSGKVVSDAGEPLEGVSVYGTASSADEWREDRATTDAEGAFTLRLPAGEARIGIQYPEWNVFEGRGLTIDGNESDVVFTLKTPPPKTAVVEGRILDEAGNPLAGAIVRIEQGCCYAYGGHAEPTPDPRPATPEPASDADATVSSDDEGSGNGTSASAGAATTRPMIAPVPAYPCCYDRGQSVTTGDDGAYRFETYGGPRQVSVQAKGYAYANEQVEAKDNATVTLDVRMAKVPERDAILRGRITDAVTGLPIAGATVSLNNQEWSRYESVRTGADGTYEIRALPGWSQVSVSVDPYYGEPMPLRTEDGIVASKPAPMNPTQIYYQYVSALRVGGETSHDVKLEPKPQPAIVLQGYVVDPDAQTGIPGAYVNVWNQDTSDWGSAVTDATGSWKILVRAGHYVVHAHADGYLGTSTTFVIAEGDSIKRVDLQTPKGQQRYAPCDECYEREIAHSSSGMDSSAPMPAPTQPVAVAGGMSEAKTDGASNRPALAGGPSSQGMAYQGGGGGLPAYSPASTSEETTTTTNDGNVQPSPNDRVPGPGAALVVLAVAGVAIALVSRRRG